MSFANGSTASLGGGIQNMTLTSTASISTTGNDLADVITAGADINGLFTDASNDAFFELRLVIGAN